MKDVEVRTLRGDDMFPLLDIFSKLNISEEVVEMMQGGATIELPPLPVLDINISLKRSEGAKLTKVEEKTFAKFNDEYVKVSQERALIIEKNGKRNITLLIQKLLSGIQLVKHEVNSFMGSMSGLSAKETGELPISKYTMILVKIFNQPEVMEVFSLAATLKENTTDLSDSETSTTSDTVTH